MIDPTKLGTVAECRQFMVNAKRHGRDDLYRAAMRRCVELQAPRDPDPVAEGFGKTLTALEECFREIHGRALKANRTRAKAKGVGIVALLTDWALGKGQDTGFDMLVSFGLGDYSGEPRQARRARHHGADSRDRGLIRRAIQRRSAANGRAPFPYRETVAACMSEGDRHRRNWAGRLVLKD